MEESREMVVTDGPTQLVVELVDGTPRFFVRTNPGWEGPPHSPGACVSTPEVPIARLYGLTVDAAIALLREMQKQVPGAYRDVATLEVWEAYSDDEGGTMQLTYKPSPHTP